MNKSNAKKTYISYRKAIKYFNNDFVLCNNLPEIDDSIFYSDYNIVNEDFYESEQEIFQYFICSCTEWDAKYLNTFFGIQFLFSEKLDCYILPVFHYGTSWDYVRVEVLDDEVARIIKNTDLEYKE
jgi:hypothetical protein